MNQGLNITATISRREAGADDDVGGATTTTVVIYRSVKSRISSLKPSEDQRVQGLETSKMYNAAIWPSTYTILEGDLYQPEIGRFIGETFRVVGVQQDSLPPTDKRAHISLRLVRVVTARTVQ